MSTKFFNFISVYVSTIFTISLSLVSPTVWSQSQAVTKIDPQFANQDKINLVYEDSFDFSWNYDVLEQGNCQISYSLADVLTDNLNFGSFFDVRKQNQDSSDDLFIITKTGFLIKDKAPASFPLGFYTDREKLKKLMPSLEPELIEKGANFEKYKAKVANKIGPFNLGESTFNVHLEEYNLSHDESFKSFTRPNFTEKDNSSSCDGELGCPGQTVCIAIPQTPPFTKYSIAMSQFYPVGKDGEHTMVVNHQITCLQKKALFFPKWILQYPLKYMTGRNLTKYIQFLRE